LSDSGFEVDAATDGSAALEKIGQHEFDVVLLDIMMPGIDGVEVLRRIKEDHPQVEVVMITGRAQIDTAVRSMKLGAFDYLPKPFDPDELRLTVERAFERRRLVQENLNLRDKVDARYRSENAVGNSAAMQEVFRLVAQGAPTGSTVLLTGESGTGKELIARAIHHNSLRSDAAFVAVDCTSLSENLLESELFGHVRGAFTGAVVNKRGLFEEARGGTLFLDEIGNIPLSIQAKLLRVIQEREFRAVGDTKTRTADVRLIAATHKDLRAMVREGSFREDLFYRLNVFPIHIPPLRERREDIPGLAHHFLARCNRELGKRIEGFSADALQVLCDYDWPGNVRELENAVHRAAILANDANIRRAHFAGLAGASAAVAAEPPRNTEELKRVKKAAREKSVEDIERAFVLEALKRNGWNISRSAEETGMLRGNFQALMRKHGIGGRAPAGAPPDDGGG
jgi:DNA-binding NtrC family response regulator